MELARAFMEEKGETMLAQALQWAARLRYKLRREGGLPCYYEEMQQIPGVSGLDGLKVLIGMGDTGLTGYDLAQQLRDRYKIQVEIADHKYILAMFSIFHQEKDWDFFYQAVTKIAQSYTGRTDPKTTALILPPYPIVVLSPRRALQAPARKLPLRECRGHIAGEMVAAYPPGIPCLLPGEMITAAVQDYLGYLQKTGARVQGPQDSSLRQLTILDI
jgi:lysine decarboxylase